MIVDKIVKRIHVKELKLHHYLKDKSKRQLWKEQVDKGLDGYIVSEKKLYSLTIFNMGNLLMLHKFQPCL